MARQRQIARTELSDTFKERGRDAFIRMANEAEAMFPAYTFKYIIEDFKNGQSSVLRCDIRPALQSMMDIAHSLNDIKQDIRASGQRDPDRLSRFDVLDRLRNAAVNSMTTTFEQSDCMN